MDRLCPHSGGHSSPRGRSFEGTLPPWAGTIPTSQARTRWSASVDDLEASGQTRRVFAGAKDVNANTLPRWRWRFSRAGPRRDSDGCGSLCAPPSKAGQRRRPSPPAERPRLVRGVDAYLAPPGRDDGTGRRPVSTAPMDALGRVTGPAAKQVRQLSPRAWRLATGYSNRYRTVDCADAFRRREGGE